MRLEEVSKGKRKKGEQKKRKKERVWYRDSHFIQRADISAK